MNASSEQYDRGEYRKYCTPAIIDKELHVLEGIIIGIEIDRILNDKELSAINKWIEKHHQFFLKSPFNELIPMLEGVLRDNKITLEEKNDLLWFCQRLNSNTSYYDLLTSDIQRLHGILAGIASDNIITVDELTGLSGWMSEHAHLKTTWPYDEIESIVSTVLSDNVIDSEEHMFLLDVCKEFSKKTVNLMLEPSHKEELYRQGVCALCPDVVFADRLFCFTGKAKHGTRSEFAKLVEARGGKILGNVRKDLNYLVVGSEGNECWAFSCYGRKIEEAMNLRREGSKIVIIHEFDFWDAVQDTMA